jgi:hypothetical protein
MSAMTPSNAASRGCWPRCSGENWDRDYERVTGCGPVARFPARTRRATDLLLVEAMTRATLLSETSPKAQVHALTSRILMLERHALTLQDSFRNATMRDDAAAVINALQRAEAWLQSVPEPDVIQRVEAMVDSASRRLSSLGRASS